MMFFDAAALHADTLAKQLVTLGDTPGTVRAAGPGEQAIGTVVSVAGQTAMIAIDGFCGGTYVPAAVMPPPVTRHVRDECDHCGCPFPENPCHYCNMRTRR